MQEHTTQHTKNHKLQAIEEVLHSYLSMNRPKMMPDIKNDSFPVPKKNRSLTKYNRSLTKSYQDTQDT